MDKSRFSKSSSGHLIPTVEGSQAFVPDPLPPGIDKGAVADELARASQALGELNGIGRTVENPYLLIRPLQTREALASSSMEGTYSTVAQLMLLEAGLVDQPNDTREVRNYVVALRRSIDSLDRLPLCLRTIREAHAILMDGVSRHRGGTIRPGEFKEHQNWIGAPTIDKARFVPPPPGEAREAMYQLEAYVQRDDRESLHPLIDAALVHYQFEAIHPFQDDNGRVGRIVIPVLLAERGLLHKPLLYVSPFLDVHKDEYIDRMFAVSADGDWTGWIRFFLTAIEQSALHTVDAVDRLRALQSDYRSRLQKAGRSALLLTAVDFIYEQPVFTTTQLASRLGVTYPAAQKNIATLLATNVVEEVPNTSHPKYYAASELLRAIDES